MKTIVVASYQEDGSFSPLHNHDNVKKRSIVGSLTQTKEQQPQYKQSDVIEYSNNHMKEG